jgi:RNA 3'-terminal phosphate cyclase (ATP)/RNA 3'-terminal phosphate cyclase (GTP)
MAGTVQIDGSSMEGGGQILRTASALSVLTKKPVRIFNIRAKRPQPGLRTQHMRGLEAIAGLCNGSVEGNRPGSREIVFRPGGIAAEEITITLETAASVGLVLQSVLIASIGIKKRLVLDIEGGATFGKYAPPLQYVQFVLLPLLRRMGHHAEINILRHGFFPVGGARVKVMIEPCQGLEPLVMEERGDVEQVEFVSVASGQLRKPRVAERQARAAVEILEGKGLPCSVKTRYSDSACPGSGLVAIARTGRGCIIGADGLGERGKPAEAVAEEAAVSLLGSLATGATVDAYMADQLLPYIGMAGKGSTFTAPGLTTHARTNMWVTGQFLPVEFVTENEEAVTRITVSSKR